METQLHSILSFPSDCSEEGLRLLAEKIMNEICIFNGKYTYHPIEIEFYIYDSKNHADIHVYPREAKVGDLFFHLSGMDICFESSLEEKEGRTRFGGILIRALEREDGKQFGGPLTCKNEVLNTASSEKCIAKIHTISPVREVGEPTKRKGINQSKTLIDIDNYWNAPYRFFINSLHVGDTITMETDSFDFRKCKVKPSQKRYYKIED